MVTQKVVAMKWHLIWLFLLISFGCCAPHLNVQTFPPFELKSTHTKTGEKIRIDMRAYLLAGMQTWDVQVENEAAPEAFTLHSDSKETRVSWLAPQSRVDGEPYLLHFKSKDYAFKTHVQLESSLPKLKRTADALAFPALIIRVP